MVRIRSRLAKAAAAAALLATALLLGPGPAAAGAAGYRYKITDVKYEIDAEMQAERQPDTCQSGTTAGWAGTMTSTTSELQEVFLGDGALSVHKHGTSGGFDSLADVDYTFNGLHTLTTDCMSGASNDTTCPDSGTSALEASGEIKGGVGDRVTIIWDFRQADGPGRWVPDGFSCVEPFTWAYGPCKSRRVPLSTFTKKHFKLSFAHCAASSTTPPAMSGWSNFSAYSFLDGYIQLVRTG